MGFFIISPSMLAVMIIREGTGIDNRSHKIRHRAKFPSEKVTSFGFAAQQLKSAYDTVRGGAQPRRESKEGLQ